MSHIAVWTDENERVQRKHYHPEDVDTSDAHEVHEEGVAPDVADWVSVNEFYNPTDGFYYETEDPLAGLTFSDAEKQRLFDAVQDNDLVEARNIVEEALKV